MSKIHRLFFVTCCYILRGILRLRYKIEIKGLEKVDSLSQGKTGLLFLPNHPAEIDPIILTAILGPKYIPRSVIVEHFYRIPVFKKILDCARVIPVPSMDEKANKWKKRQLDQVLSRVEQLIQEGQNFIIYPSGRLKCSGLERIGGASFVHDILSGNGSIRAVLVRTTGLWGSSFSVAQTGSSPDFGKTLLAGIKVVWKNLCLFVPKRKVLVEFYVPDALPVQEGRLEFNRCLESWYNADGQEPLSHVPYFFWSKGEEKSSVQIKEEVQERPVVLDEKIKQDVFAYLAELAKMSVEKIREDSHLSFDLGLDSLDIATIHAFLDKKYDAASVPLGDLKKVVDVLRAIAEKDRGVNVAKESRTHQATSFARWEEDAKDRKIGMPSGQTIPEVFLHNCRRMGSCIAAAENKMGVLSYRQCQRIVLVLAEAFRTIPGERVGLLLPSCILVNLCVFALLLANKVPVMLNWTVGKNAMNHAMKTADFSVTLTSGKFLDRIHLEDLGDVEETFLFLEDVRESLGWKDRIRGLIRSWVSVERVLRIFSTHKDPDRSAVILFTSGSESLPKGVPLSHHNILSNQRALWEHVAFTKEDSLYAALPPFHSLGFSLTGILPLLSGLKVFYTPDPTDNQTMLEDIRKRKLSILCLAPSFLKALFAQVISGDLASLRWVVSGAEKPAPEVPRYVKEQISGAHWMEGYGITECSPVVTLYGHGEHNAGVGRPLSNVSLCVVEPGSSQILPEGKDGEICIHGPNVFAGYLGACSDPFLDMDGKRWYRSGDLGHIDSYGNLHIVDRLKRIVKIGGEMLSLVAIEQEVQKICADRMGAKCPEGPVAAVIASGIDKPQLILFTLAEIQADEVNHMLREAGWGRIAKICKVVRLEQIPMTGTGKMHYRMLEEQWRNEHAATI